jgi:hypothetical protein
LLNETDGVNHEENKQTRDYKYRKLNNDKRKNTLRQNLINNAVDKSETDSTISTSTANFNNYTLKQYWRKFIQTRQNQSNPKKNLFHLIAEEKKKTRTLSKSSLEDGFVITTSNNLLAPNDESNVIVFARPNPKANQQQQQQASSASRFFTRIANSIRSLAQGSSVAGAINQSSRKIPAAISPESYSESSPLKSNNSDLSINIKSNNRTQTIAISTTNTPNNNNNNNNNSVQQEHQLPIQLISVFDGPVNNDSNINNNNNNIINTIETNVTDNSKMPTQLANVFMQDAQLNEYNSLQPNEIDYQDSEEDDDEQLEEIELHDDNNNNSNSKKSIQIVNDEEESPRKYVNNYNKNNVTGSGGGSTSNPTTANNSLLKTSRYLSYRNSLTNSVRGSLLECSVPEDAVPNEFENSMGSASAFDDSNEMNKLAIKKRLKQQRRVQQRNVISTPVKSGSATTNNKYRKIYNNHNATIVTSNNFINKNQEQKNSHKTNTNLANDLSFFNMKFNGAIMNGRRFISTIDASSFFNVSINLETIEYNLRNSMIKSSSCCTPSSPSTDNNNNYIRNVQHSKKAPNAPSLFSQYLDYLINLKLALNPLLIFLNFSFFLNIIGN